jgi:protein involved in polysaccharide export with SLBB domain
MEIMRMLGRGISGLGLIVAGVLMVGCGLLSDGGGTNNPPIMGPGGTNTEAGTNTPGIMEIKVGDTITVNFSDVVNPILPVADQVKEDGSITLIFNQKFQAAGKRVSVLQDEIRARYVPDYFKNMTPTVSLNQRFFSVGGEVRMPNREVYVDRMTVLGAIDVAGGFTDYSNRKKVKLTRPNGKIYTINCIKAVTHPELNMEVFPGDSVFVPKRIW